jgi:arginyl-tRNA synthetase
VQIPGISHGEAVKGYLNLYFSTAEYARRVVDTVLADGEKFGAGHPKNERVMVEYAQPNTHHSFHIGHYRNTILGESPGADCPICRVRDHSRLVPGRFGPGRDYGAVGLRKVLQRPRTRRHSRARTVAVENLCRGNQPADRERKRNAEEKAQREAYDAERREMYRKWDAGDPAVRQLWLETREWSMEELRDILAMMDVKIDVWFYESEVDEPSKKIVDELIARGIAEDERPSGPVIVKIDEKLGLAKEKYRVAVILRSDGTSLVPDQGSGPGAR